jgi:ABC-type glycerol-3-phosphate transport system substrate-binding protein
LNFMAKWWAPPEKGGIMSFEKYGNQDVEFKSGRLAMKCGTLPSGMTDKWDIVPFPVGPDADPKSLFVGISGWSIPTGAKNPTGALAFVNLMNTPLDPENVDKENKENLLKYYQEAVDPLKIYNKFYGPDNIIEDRILVGSPTNNFADAGAFYWYVNEALSTGKTPSQVATEYEPVLQASLDKTLMSK